MTNGSLEIIHIAQLTAVLDTFKNKEDSDTNDDILGADITALEGVVAALPVSQIRVNGG